MRRSHTHPNRWRGAAALAVLVLMTGCASRSYEAPDIELVAVPEAVPESRLLDLGLIVLDPGLPEDEDDIPVEVDADIRRAEGRYFAYHLKSTLQNTRQWGAVRVVPNLSVAADVHVGGEVRHSDGNTVELRLWARDARGERWFSRKYSARTDRFDYSRNRDRMADPYQNVFNEFANDLYAEMVRLTDEDIEDIRTTARIRFYADMAPAVYGDYVESNRKGDYEVVRLPAPDDPMAARLDRIRNQDALFQDTLNEHYANFYYGIALPYESWRKASREAELEYQRLRRSALLRGLAGVAMVAASSQMSTGNTNDSDTIRRTKGVLRSYATYSGVDLFFSSFGRLAEARLQRESIRELSDSFGAEAAPMVIEVEGRTQRLSGTASSQYDQWRELLRQINERDTGFAQPVIGINGRTGEESTGG